MLLLASSALVIAQTQTSETLVTMNGKKVKYDQKMTTTDRDNLPNKVAGMLIYNYTTKSHEYWDGSAWHTYASGSGNPSSGGEAEISNIDCKGSTGGTMTAGTAITANSVTKTISVTVTKIGSYTITATANGVTFTKTSTFSSTGVQNVTLVAVTGNIPTVGGVISYTLSTTPSCSFNMPVLAPIPPGAGGGGYQPEISVTGRVWLDRNMGATQPASANVKESIGSLYQWGRGNDGHQLVTWNADMRTVSAKSPTTTTLYSGGSASPGHENFIASIGNGYDWSGGTYDWRTIPINDLWSNPAYNSVANPCPAGYRVPTAPELLREIVANGVNGWQSFTAGWHPGPSPYSRIPTGIVGSWYNGYDFDPTPTFMWTSTPSGNGAALGWSGQTRDNHNYVVEPARQFQGYDKKFGAVVRCIKD